MDGNHKYLVFGQKYPMKVKLLLTYGTYCFVRFSGKGISRVQDNLYPLGHKLIVYINNCSPKILNNGKQKQPRNYTLFIATIALVAPFIPVEIEVLAYNAYKRNLEIMKNETQASPLENKEFF